MEQLLQYAWQHRMWESPLMSTTDGRAVEVLDTGWINNDAGPDFFNAKVKIGDKVWVGNIEIHIKSSDWFRHNHHTDKAYDSVILHVVETDDAEVHTLSGYQPPQLVLKCADKLLKLHDKLSAPVMSHLVCADFINAIPQLYINGWIDTLAHERLYEKVDRFNNYLRLCGGNWQQAVFVALARGLGFGHNSDALERVALSLPLNVVGKHSDSLKAIEAFLLGQAQLLPMNAQNEDEKVLLEEYRFLAHKFQLTPPRGLIWKNARMRPGNMPLNRLKLLASYLYGGFSLMQQIIESDSIEKLRATLQPSTTESLPANSINTLIINVAVPAMFAYGSARNDDALCERAWGILRSLPSEQNNIVKLFSSAGIQSSDAYTSQALIQLRRSYCEQRKCLFCRIGNFMMRKNKKLSI